MRLLLCSAVLATALIGVYGFPTDSAESDVPRKGGNPNNKPLPAGVEKPRPSLVSKPSSPQVSDNLHAAQSPSPATFVQDVAQSSVSSELPSAEASLEAASEAINNPVHLPAAEAPQDSILETVENFHVPEAVLQDALPEAVAVAPVEPEVLSVDHAPASEAVPALIPGLEVDSSAEGAVAVADVELESHPELDTKVAAFVAGKSRRHAGVEKPTSLRIGDFEDVESESGLAAPEYPGNREQIEMAQGISKEEMILMAMEQSHPNLPHMQLSGSGPRPSKGRPNIMHSSPSLNAKPHFQNSFEDDEESESEVSEDDDQTVDLRNADEPATIVQEQPKPQLIAKVNSESSPQVSQVYGSGSGSRNKPRPYGMDRPSKNRPTLDSGMKDKNEHFGLPHSSSSSSNDYIQKGEGGLSSSDSGTTSYLGFQIPSIKWASFTDLWGLPNFWGTRNRHHGMGKSDQPLEEPCVDDEDSLAGDGIRSPVIQQNSLCQSSGVASSCHAECIDKGYASGSCLGPYPTPGCLCRKPSVHAQSKDVGMMLRPLEVKSAVPEGNRGQDLEISLSPPCKKCACMDACKQSGSFTGFCVDRCYCAVPWAFEEQN